MKSVPVTSAMWPPLGRWGQVLDEAAWRNSSPGNLLTTVMRRGTLTILATTAALAAAPAMAHASVATTSDGNLRYDAAPGEYNNVTFSRVSGDTFKVVDPNAFVSA